MDCPWCKVKVDNQLDKLAEHIFKSHSNNIELCAWARAELAKIGKLPKDNEPKYRGKPLNRVPPSRQDKIPKYLKRQLKG